MGKHASVPSVIVPGGGLFGGRLQTFDALPSTHQWVLDNIGGYRHGDVVRALDQQAGRGRLNRCWYSPPGSSLTISILVDLNRLHETVPSVLGQAAALGVLRALNAFDIPAQLKWPNDILVEGRKIAGILAERHAETDIVVIGIGLNVNITGSELATLETPCRATSMQIARGRSVSLEGVLKALLTALESSLPLAATSGLKDLIRAWSTHDYLAGRNITVMTSTGQKEGRYLGMTPDGAMRMQGQDGKEKVFLAGDVSLAQPLP